MRARKMLAAATLAAMLMGTGIQTAPAAPTRDDRVERTQAKPKCKKKNPSKKCKKGGKDDKGGGGGYAGYFNS